MSDSFVTTHTVSLQAPLSVGFFREECWSRLPFSTLEALPHLRIEPVSPVSQVDSVKGRKWQLTPIFLPGIFHG